MFHVIEFRNRVQLGLEVSRQRRMERLLVQPGMRLCVEIRPQIREGPGGPIECADLYLDDGATARCIPFAWFAFVEAGA